ncbi:MFS transporter [bacterium]|nr:MFS transporter [bacterium]
MREDKRYKLIYFTRFLGEFIFSILLTIFLKDRGFSGVKLGTLLSFSPFILALSLPLWALIDKGRSRKMLVIAASAMLIILELLIYKTQSFAVVAILMVFYSISRAPLSPSLDSMTTVYCIENKKEFSSFRIFGSVGYILAILIGSYLYEKLDFIYIIFTSIIFLSGFIITSIFTKALDIDKVNKHISEEKHDFKLLFTNKAFIVFLIAQLLCAAVLMLNNSYEIIYLQYRGVPTSQFGVTTLIRVTSEILALLLLRKIKPNFKLFYILIPLMILPQSIIYFSDAPIYTLYLVVITAGAASGFQIFLNNKYISHIVSPRNITIATYSITMLQNIFTALYILLGGVIIDHAGIKYVYLCSGIMFIIAAIFITIFFKTKLVPWTNSQHKNVAK